MLLTILGLIAVLPATLVQADDLPTQEQYIKVAFICNFIKFVEWPKEESVSKDTPIIIGIIGSQSFVRAFGKVKHKKIKNRRILIKYFTGFELLTEPSERNGEVWQKKLATLKNCDVLLFCNGENGHAGKPREIIESLGKSSVLTIGETSGFLEFGGIINFLTEDNKVRFEISNVSGKKAKLRISSKLLHLAKRVILDTLPD